MDDNSKQKKGTFQPGHEKTGGRQAKPKWLKECEQMTAVQFVSTLNNLMNLPVPQVLEIAASETLPIKDCIMASWLRSAMMSTKDRDSLFNRLFGMPKQTMELGSNEDRVITLAYKPEPPEGK